MSKEAPSRREFIAKAATITFAIAACGTPSSKKGGEVVLITWADPQKAKRLGDAFKAKTGITMKMVPGDGDVDFFNKIKSGGGDQYDVVISNVGYAQTYEKNGMIETLDLGHFPSTKELYPAFRNDMRFSYLKGPDKSLVFPNEWGVYAMTYSKAAYKSAAPTSWDALWKAPHGKVVLDGSLVVNLGMTLRAMGMPWDQVLAAQGADLDKAVDRLRQLKPFLTSGSGQASIDAFRTEAAVIGQIFGLGFYKTVNDKIGQEVTGSVVPSEGAIGALDGQMLIKGARNRDNALELIDFIGGQKGQEILWDLYLQPCANKAATEAIIGRGGSDATVMKVQEGDDPVVCAGLLQVRQPDHPEAWNQAWDRVLAG